MRFDDAILLILAGVVVMFVVPAIADRFLNRRVTKVASSASDDHCPTCGYDRRGSGAICPECGNPTPRFLRVGLDPHKLQANWPDSAVNPREAAIDETRLLLWTAPHAGMANALVDQLRTRGIPATCSSIDGPASLPLTPSDRDRLYVRVVVPEMDFGRALLIAETFARD